MVSIGFRLWVWLHGINKKGADMKWLLITLVVIADAIYDKYFDEADDEQRDG